jgi:outer membrane protein
MKIGLGRTLAAALVCTGALLLPHAAAAQQKVAFVDPQEVVASSNEGKQIRDRLEAIQKEKQSSLDAREKEFTTAQQEFQSQLSILTPEKLEERQLELQRLKGRLQRDAETAQEELLLERQRLLGPLLRRVENIIREVGKEDGYTIILQPHQGIVYFDDGVNITKKVIERINKK